MPFARRYLVACALSGFWGGAIGVLAKWALVG